MCVTTLCTISDCIVDLKQIARYFSRKDGFIWKWKRIVILDLQSCQATSKFLQSKEEECFYGGKKEVGRGRVSRAHGFPLAEILTATERSLSSSCWALVSLKGLKCLLLDRLHYLTEVSAYPDVIATSICLHQSVKQFCFSKINPYSNLE